MASNPMTYEQAALKASQLHDQGMTYPKIEEALRTMGYVSSRTKKAPGHLAIRHMVTQLEKADKREEKREKKAAPREEKKVMLSTGEETKKVLTPNGNDRPAEFEDIVTAIMSLDSRKVNRRLKLKMVELLTQSELENMKA